MNSRKIKDGARRGLFQLRQTSKLTGIKVTGKKISHKESGSEDIRVGVLGESQGLNLTK
jgi:hypothetical protein